MTNNKVIMKNKNMMQQTRKNHEKESKGYNIKILNKNAF